MTNYFKLISDEEEFSGLNLIIGSYCIHLLECEAKTMTKMLRKLNETALAPSSIY